MTIGKSAPGPSRPRPPVRQGPAAARPPTLPSDAGVLIALRRPPSGGSETILTPTSSAELTPRSVKTPATLDGVGATVRRKPPVAHARRQVLRAWAPTVGAGLLAAVVTLALGALAVRTFLPSDSRPTQGAASGAAVEQAAGPRSPVSVLPATAAAPSVRPSGSSATAASASALPATVASANASAAGGPVSGRRRPAGSPTTAAPGRATPPVQGTGSGADYLPGVL